MNTNNSQLHTFQKFQKDIDALGTWYQPIEFVPRKLRTPSKYSFDSTLHGKKKWDFILRRNLPKSLSGKRILDLGCASGLYPLLLAREGATVVGVELDRRAFQQSMLTRTIFSELDKKDYTQSVEFVPCDIIDFDWNRYGQFDIVLALNVLYWIDTTYSDLTGDDRRSHAKQDLHKLIENIHSHTKLFVVQADENKFRTRVKRHGSTEATNADSVRSLLKQHRFHHITIDKPFAPESIWRTLTARTAEVDLRQPLFYARPIISGLT